jgi:hypothetical protein
MTPRGGIQPEAFFAFWKSPQKGAESMAREIVSLMQAAATLRVGYRTALDLVLRGELRGGQDRDRKWHVDAADLARLVSERQREERAPAVA